MDQTYTYSNGDNESACRTNLVTWENIWQYTWTRLRSQSAPGQDNENRLIAAEIPEQKRLEFTYDFQGRRRTKKVYTWDDPTQSWLLSETHTYLYDGWNVIRETVNPSGGGQGSNRFYVWGLDLSNSLQGAGLPRHSSFGTTAGGIGGILSSVTTDADGNTAHQCFLYHFNGNVVNLADPVTAATTATYEYSPFGKILIAHGPAADQNPLRFSTKWQDETGLSYYGYRYYDARMARWISRDPIEETAGASLYRAVRNSAIVNLDPNGTLVRTLFNCFLVATKLTSKCTRACQYFCVEDMSKRTEMGLEPPLLSDMPKFPIVRIPPPEEHTSWLCNKTKGLLCGPPSRKVCRDHYIEYKLYTYWSLPMKNCSRSQCRKGCDFQYMFFKKACLLLGPYKKLCEQSASVYRYSCRQLCDAMCNKP